MKLPESIRITDVGPRDGLQNQDATISVADKVRFVDLLARSGVAEVEVSSFVSAKWVPQLGDAEAVFEALARVPGVTYSALVPNLKGMERALAAHEHGALDKVAVFTAASETFSARNTNATIAETLERFGPVIAAAGKKKIPVRGYISCAIACPYEGPVEPAAVLDVAQRMLDLGVDEIDLGDTIGVAVPTDIERLYDGLTSVLQPSETTLHLHDTRGTALACAVTAMQLGVRSFDASCTGLGGCPYAPGAAGNLATEDLVYLADRMGVSTGVDLDGLIQAGRHIAAAVGRPAMSRVFRAISAVCSSDGGKASSTSGCSSRE